MDGIIENVKCLFNRVLHKIKDDIVRDLQAFACLSSEQISIVETHMETAANPFQGLETHYLQDKYYAEHLDYLVGFAPLHLFAYV